MRFLASVFRTESTVARPLCSHEKKTTHEDTVVIRRVSPVRCCRGCVVYCIQVVLGQVRM